MWPRNYNGTAYLMPDGRLAASRAGGVGPYIIFDAVGVFVLCAGMTRIYNNRSGDFWADLESLGSGLQEETVYDVSNTSATQRYRGWLKDATRIAVSIGKVDPDDAYIKDKDGNYIYRGKNV